MEHMMNQLGWWFVGCSGGRLVFAKGGASVQFKDWAQIADFVKEQKNTNNGEAK